MKKTKLLFWLSSKLLVFHITDFAKKHAAYRCFLKINLHIRFFIKGAWREMHVRQHKAYSAFEK